MASNFGSNFLRGFQPNFANMFNDSYRNAFISDEQERRRKEEEKAKQEQLGILSQLFRGTKDVPSFQNNRVPLMNAGQSFGNQEVPLSKQEQFDLRAKLSPSSALSFLDNQNAPQKQKKTVKVGNSVYQESPEYENVPMGDPLFTEKKEVKPDFVETDYVGNRQVRREFYKQEDGTVKSVDIPTGFFKETRVEKTDDSGNLYKDLDKNYIKELDQRVDKFLTAQDIKKAADQTKGGVPYIDPLTGMKYTINSETAGGMVDSGKSQLQNYLDTQGSAENEKYWKDSNIESWNAIQQEGKGDHAVTTWKYIEEDYIKGEISQADFLENRYRFIAKWGYDPTRKMR